MRPFALALAVGFALFAGLLATPPARAVFDRMEVDPAVYSGLDWVYVPTETMTITIYADPADVFDLEIWDQSGGPRTSLYQFDDLTLATGQASKAVQWTVPAASADGFGYWIGVYPDTFFETGAGGAIDLYNFWVWAYESSYWFDRTGYLPGDTVTLGWSVTLIKDGSPAPDGSGYVSAYDDALVRIGQRAFNASRSTFAFTLNPTLTPDFFGSVRFWFNDTGGLHPQLAGLNFYVGDLGVIASTGVSYTPGSLVTVNIDAKVANPPSPPRVFDPAARGVTVNVTVLELATGNVIPQYGATNLIADSQGHVTHVFRLNDSAAAGDYQVQVRAEADGTLSASQSVSFSVDSPVSMSVEVSFNRAEYMTGETVQATATVFRSTPATYTYAWTVRDASTGAVFSLVTGAGASFDFTIPSTFRGTLSFQAVANDGLGMERSSTRTVPVEYGYLALSLDRSEYEAGGAITASFQLDSNVMTNPTYYVEVEDANGDVVWSTTAAGTSATFPVPDPASSDYTFRVTASQDGRVVSEAITAYEVQGYILTVSLDRPAYLPGETVRVHYAITARGSSPLPAQFEVGVFLGTFVATPLVDVLTTSAEGDLSFVVPQGTGAGDVVLIVAEQATNTMSFQTLRIGSTNPLWATEIAGIPAFAILLAILVAILFVVVLLLWRRGGMGMGVPRAKPTPPPPPPAGPGQASSPSAGPMSVSCRHCGKPIELTTSKRPIEVMCPSCGETQLVQ